MKFSLTQIPLIKLLFCASIGFLIVILMNFNLLGYLILISIIIVGICVFLILKFYQLSYILITLLIGIIISFNSQSINITSPNKITPEFSGSIEGTITNILKQDSNYIRCIVDGSIDSRVLKKINNTKVILNITNISNNYDLYLPGTNIFALAKIRVPYKKQLPNEFSEEDFSNSIDVQWIAISSSEDVAINNYSQGYNFLSYKISNILKERAYIVFSKNNFGIMTALLTGDKSYISQETKELFSLSGTAHVLAISGLHVGLIVSILYLILGFIENKWLKFSVITLIIIAFILITGMQPSALRAGIGFICFLFLKSLERIVNPLNILGLVVLLLILIFPNFIFSAAFYMSVASYGGIILLYNPIKQNLHTLFKNNIFNNDYIINSFSLSISASISVSPIVAYYFHQYSIISPLSNLIVIPVMSLGMILGYLSILFSFINLNIASIYGVATDICLDFSKWINSIALQIPYSYIKNEYIFVISISISLLLLYVFLSINKRIMAFRISFSVLSFALLYLLMYSNNVGTNIYARLEFTSFIYQINNNKSFVLIEDRKPMQYSSIDYNFLNYLSNKQDSLVIGITGNSGIALTDEIKKIKTIQIIDIPLDKQEHLRKLFNINTKLSQIIDI